MIVALASPKPATSLGDGLEKIEGAIADAASRGARIVCFPEAYLPGLRGQDFNVIAWDAATQEHMLSDVTRLAREHHIAVIVGLEWIAPAGRHIAAAVIDAHGMQLGVQFKTQLDPSEDRYYLPGDSRVMFEIEGLTFGIAICHEGWRYPETVRWAATRGAQIVFHPQLAGNERSGARLTTWGSPDAPYYERAMMMRSIENAIYFASVNYAVRFQEAATSIIAPGGACVAHLPYNEPGVLVYDLDLASANGVLAKRYAPERYRMEVPQ